MIPQPPELAALRAWQPDRAITGVAPLHGDGSARRYFRVESSGASLILLVGPDDAENAAFVRIGRHLAERGIRVPEIFDVDEARGWILLEDLGDVNLYGMLKKTPDGPGREALYAPVLDLLARLQLDGAQGFSLRMGFAPAPYGPELMVEGEGLYFVREFCRGILNLPVDEAAVAAELSALAQKAAKAPGGYFLHRDFQSRNVHRAPQGWAALDFQGARPGPLAYDAAALICDPYAANGPATREALLGRYLALLEGRADAGAVAESFPRIGAFRLMQALGAYGKLGGRLKKPGFLEHSGAALAALIDLLAAHPAPEAPRLRALAARAAEAWITRNAS